MRKKIIIFGAGHYGRAVLRKCAKDKKYRCICFLDNNRKKHNTFVLKKRVYHVSNIKKINFDKIIFSGRYVKDQVAQVKKFKINENKFLIWGKSKVLPSRNKLIKREKILLKMLSYVIKKFNQNKIRYWIDFSGLLALIRRQNLAEMSDVDISINLYDVKKVYKILKNNKNFYSFPKFYYQISNYPKFVSGLKKNKKLKQTIMFIVGNVNPQIIEPPMIDFIYKKITKKKVINVQKNEYLPLKYFRSFDLVKYKGLVLRTPKNSTQYLRYLYGKSWKKQAEFWSPLKKE